jgi:MFS family permease
MGGIFGNVLISWISERHGRKIAMMVAAAISFIGQILSGGSAHNWGMLIFARVLVGAGGWPLAAVAVTYQSELSITEVRGFLASLVGISIAVGFSSAAWIGYAFYHYHGQQAWRIPMLIGAAIPLLLLLLAPFVPESPRWLCLHGRQEEAKEIVYRIHKSPADPNNI